MTTRIVVPVEDESGLEARLAEHFGRAPFFAVVDLGDNNKIVSVKTEPNRGEHVGGSGHPHEHLLVLRPNVFVVQGMGPGCLRSLQSAGINVLKANSNTVKEIVVSYGEDKLMELTGGCEHAHHHSH